MCVILLAVLIACGSDAPPSDVVRVTFDVDGAAVVFTAEVADDDVERAQGLMGRTSLAQDAGMLFVWDEILGRPFWMKDTLIPLDLIAMADGVVVSVHTMQPCPENPCPFTTTEPADAALEVRAGTAARLGIAVGTAVTVGRIE